MRKCAVQDPLRKLGISRMFTFDDGNRACERHAVALQKAIDVFGCAETRSPERIRHGRD